MKRLIGSQHSNRTHVSTNVRLRPVRFALTLNPSNKAKVDNAIVLNSCLWGGVHNPLIPYFDKTPNWWKPYIKKESASEILDRYLDFFEPDFIVHLSNISPKKTGYHQSRILTTEDVLAPEEEYPWNGYGRNIVDLLPYLYQKIFRFQSRLPRKIFIAKSKDKKLDTLVRCLFGGFPSDDKYAYIERSFIDAIGAEQMSFDANKYAEYLDSEWISIFDINSFGIHEASILPKEAPIFLFRGTNCRDLVEFWNFRVLYPDVIAAPIEWIEPISEYLKTLIKKFYRPIKNHPDNLMHHATFAFSTSISEVDRRSIFESFLKVLPDDSNARQMLYPRIRKSTETTSIALHRPILEVSEQTTNYETSTDELFMEFQYLSPKGAERFGNDCRWANIVKITNWSRHDNIATCHPNEYREKEFSRYARSKEDAISTSEGMLLFPSYIGIKEKWNLFQTPDEIISWLKERGITASISPAGQTTVQIIQTLEGFWGVGKIANEKTIRLLNSISEKPDKTIRSQTFYNKVKGYNKDSIFQDDAAENIISSDALELGLEVRCPNCRMKSWNALTELSNILLCRFCRKNYPFPKQSPNSDTSYWAYRLVGPFAQIKFANGAYASSLSLRFFSEILKNDPHGGIAWAPGVELDFLDGPPAEVDFIIWYEKRYPQSHHLTNVDFIFGESKSFGSDVFDKSELEKAKRLSRAFPGGYYVFSTLRRWRDVSDTERDLLKSFANWGLTKSSVPYRFNSYLIILTGDELFSDYSLRTTWESIGGKAKELISPAWIREDQLDVVADLTQQLYLELPSIHTRLTQRVLRYRAARPSRPT